MGPSQTEMEMQMGMEIVNQLQTEGLREGRGDGPIIKAKWCRQKEEGAVGR